MMIITNIIFYLLWAVLADCASLVRKEDLIRTKRLVIGEYNELELSGKSVRLPVPAQAQTLAYSCGPTAAYAMLRFWGVQRETLSPSLDSVSGNNCVDALIRAMSNENFSPIQPGTSPDNFVEGINRRIQGLNLNNRRFYQGITLLPSLYTSNPERPWNDYSGRSSIYLRIARFVYDSLINDAPVAFGFRGRFSIYESERDHFIVITGIEISERDEVTFYYMDPDGGVQRSFRHTQLNTLLVRGGVLIVHRPGVMVPMIPPRPTPGASTTSSPGSGHDFCTTMVRTEAAGGAVGGAMGGAIFGTAILPGIGTAIGAALGALSGSAIAAGVGATVAC